MSHVKFPLPQPQPTTPIHGIEVKPVVFQSPAMQRLARAARDKAGSRRAVIKPKRASRAILWQGRPFYWTTKGFYRAGSGDRKPLQHLLWEKRSGRKMPAGHEIFFRDRDRHNFSPENMELLSKAAMHRRILDIGEGRQPSLEVRQQIANRRWERTGKNQTALLLKKFQSGETCLTTTIKEKSNET